MTSSALILMAESSPDLNPEFENDLKTGVAPDVSISDQIMADLRYLQ